MEEISKWKSKGKIEDINVDLCIIEQVLQWLNEELKNTANSDKIIKLTNDICNFKDEKELLRLEKECIKKLLTMDVYKNTIYNEEEE